MNEPKKRHTTHQSDDMPKNNQIKDALKSEASAPSGWRVYIARCVDGSLYTGIARNAERRVREHNNSDALAAKYTRVRRPVMLVYQELCLDRAEAARREYAIKRLHREEKLLLIAEQNDAPLD